MIHLDYNSTKTVTLYLQPSLVTPTYLLSLVNYTTRKRKSFIAADLSGASSLLQFSITEVGTGSESLLTGSVSVSDFGRHTLEVYEQVSTTSLDVSLATKLGDDEIFIHKEQTYDAPPPRNELEEESICALTASATSTPETATGANDGTATASFINSIGTITYLWNDPLEQTTQTATGLAPGVYIVIVSDDGISGCTSYASIQVFEHVATPTCDLIITSVSSTAPTLPGGSDGTATVTVANNVGSVNYFWEGGQTVSTATGLSSGIIGVSASDNGVGATCIKASSTIISTGGDSEAVAYIEQARITDLTQQLAVNGLVVDLKGFGLWDKVYVMYPILGGTALTHSYNLKDPLLYRVMWNGSITHDSTGISGSSNGYGDTTFNPNGIVDQDSLTLGFYSRSNTPLATGVDMGAREVNTFAILQMNNGFVLPVINSEAGAQTAITDANKLITTTRTADNIIKSYRGAIEIGSSSKLSSGIPDLNLYLMARNRNGAADAYSPRQGALYLAMEGLAPSEIVDLNTAVETYQTALSRNV